MSAADGAPSTGLCRWCGTSPARDGIPEDWIDAARRSPVYALAHRYRVAHNLFTSDPYNYRDSIGVWWRSIFYLHPNVSAADEAPLIYQLHAIIAWLFWASFPFSRLVHAWSIPLQYLGRPYILYRRRYSTAR